MTCTAFDEEIGDEVERIEVLPCRRCGDRGMTERAVVGVVLTVLVVLIAWFVIVPVLGVQAVECTNNHRPDGRAPAMQVEVTTDRKGRIIERSIGECTFFSYKGPAWNTD